MCDLTCHQESSGIPLKIPIFVDALGKHPLCHRMCKVTKETLGANKIMRNEIDSTSITFRWTSAVRLFHDYDRQENQRKWQPVAEE